MGRKNTFKPSLLINDKSLSSKQSRSGIDDPLTKPSHFNKIIWFTNNDYKTKIDDTVCDTMEKYIGFLKNSVFGDIDQSNIFNTNDIVSYIVVGICEINSFIKLNIDDDVKQYMYLITDKDYKKLFLSLDITYPIFWYSFDTKKSLIDSFDSVYEAYNQKKYTIDHTSVCRGFIGTEKMLDVDIDSIENHFIMNKYTEPLLWGSKWKDHPFRHVYLSVSNNTNLNSRKNIIYTSQAMRQIDSSTHHISVRSQLSKSVITVEDNEGAYIVNIQYNPLHLTGLKNNPISNINKLTGSEYPDDIPMDILISIINFPFVTHTGILDLSPLTSYNFLIAYMIANTSQLCSELIQKIHKVINKLKDDNSSDKELLEFAIQFVKNLQANTTVDDIFTNENVMQLIYDKISSLHKNEKTFQEIKDEITEEIDKKLEKLKIYDSEFKSYLQNIVNSILVDKK